MQAKDLAGNVDQTPAGHNWTVDTVSPDTQIDSVPPDPDTDSTPTFAFSSPNDPTATFECHILPLGYAVCSSPYTMAAMIDGRYTFEVRAKDAAGNTDPTPPSHTWTIGPLFPDTSIDIGPDDPDNDSTPTFTFSSDKEGSTFECRVEPVSFAPCASPHTTGVQADGQHTFHVRATDTGGNTDATPATHVWTVDTVLPDTAIESGPLDPDNDATPTFNFLSADPLAIFECRVNSTPFAACLSPHTTADLLDGLHSFQVRAVDLAQNKDLTPAIHNWELDTSAPDTQIDSGPPNPDKNTTPEFAFTSPDNPEATFECRLDTAPWTPCVSPRTVGALADGQHSFSVRAADSLGNTDPTPASHDWVVDTLAPDTQIDSAPADPDADTTPTFAFSSPGEPTATFECRADSAPYAFCASPHTPDALSEGLHSFDVRAVDQATNVDLTPATHGWRVDSQAPDTAIETAPGDPDNDATPTFTFSSPDDPLATFECQADGAGFVACRSPHTTAALVDGSHAFAVRAMDGLGQTDASPATHNWTLDTVEPDTRIDSGPDDPDSNQAPAFSFSSPDDPSALFECRVDAQAFEACDSPSTTASLVDGEHTFDVQAMDAAGNLDLTPASHTWTVDTFGPATQIDSGPAADPDGNPTPSFAFSSPDDLAATFECRLDAAAFALCQSPHTTAHLVDGAHRFEVRAVDALGNEDTTPASHSWTIDAVVGVALVAPTVQVPAGAAKAGSQEVELMKVVFKTTDGPRGARLASLTLHGAGNGNDKDHVLAVEVWNASKTNRYGVGTYDTDNGVATITLTGNPDTAAGEAAIYLVTYDLAGTELFTDLGGPGVPLFALVFFGLMVATSPKRRRGLAGFALLIGLLSCGGGWGWIRATSLDLCCHGGNKCRLRG